MSVDRWTERIVAVIERVVPLAAPGEDVSYEVGMFPGPQGPLGMLAIFIRTPMLGVLAELVATFPNPANQDDDTVEQIVRQCIEGAFAERTKMLTEAAKNAPPAPNGQAGPSGLILPGS